MRLFYKSVLSSLYECGMETDRCRLDDSDRKGLDKDSTFQRAKTYQILNIIYNIPRLRL